MGKSYKRLRTPGQNDLNGSHYVVAHNDFSALRWDVQLCPLPLTAAHHIIGVFHKRWLPAKQQTIQSSWLLNSKIVLINKLRFTTCVHITTASLRFKQCEHDDGNVPVYQSRPRMLYVNV